MFRRRVPKSRPVGVISKVLRILELLDSAPAGMRLKEISTAARISKSTAFRLLAHLEVEGYLYRDDSGAYVVGPRLIRLGSASAHQMTLRKIGRPVLQDLRDAISETVNLGILVGQDVFYVDVVQSQNPFLKASRSGMFRPLYCTAMGKALISTLPIAERERLISSLRFQRITPFTIARLSQFKEEIHRIRDQGYAVDNEETTMGARCVSAVVGLCGGRLPVAVSVSGPTARMTRESVPRIAAVVQGAANAICSRLDGSDLIRDKTDER